ncbi:hypothetical protein F5Y10DRAFT_267057 [Nemania abortiva]|nr:hypothetical protein F5Y10DRAFT_267057 [Nemania abortiva]
MGAADQLDWPYDSVFLTPDYLKIFQQRLAKLKSRFRHFIETTDKEVGFDLEEIFLDYIEPASLNVYWIAQHAPGMAPADPDLVAASNALSSELQAMLGKTEPSDFQSQIEALPNPEWDAVFKGYYRLLEAAVDAFVIGDSPVFSTDVAQPHKVFRVTRKYIDRLNHFPFMLMYHRRLMTKLGDSRSGPIYAKLQLEQTVSAPDPERKRKTANSDDPTGETWEKEKAKLPKIPRLDKY